MKTGLAPYVGQLSHSTRFIIAWADRMARVSTSSGRGFCAVALCEALAASCAVPETETGDPSDEAVTLADKWEARPALAWAAAKRRCVGCGGCPHLTDVEAT